MAKNKIVWGNTNDNLFEFVSLTNDLLYESLELCKTTFCQDETVSMCTDVSINPVAQDELKQLCEVTAKDGVSIVAVEKSTGKVVAALFNKIQIKPKPDEIAFFPTFVDKTCKHDSSKALIQFMSDVDSKINLFEYYNTNCLLELMFLMTHKDYRCKKLAEGMCKASVELAKAQVKGELVVPNYEKVQFGATNAICTSNISRHVMVDKLKFECLLNLNYDDFVFKGRKYTDKLPEQKNCSIVGNKIG